MPGDRFRAGDEPGSPYIEKVFQVDQDYNRKLLISGTRTCGGGKPLHWTSCLNIAEDLATGLLYIHQNPGLTHGNLKSSNVLLGPDFESCLTDYGLTVFRVPDLLEEPGAATSGNRQLNRLMFTASVSVQEEETESGDEPSSGNEASEGKLQALLNIAMACDAVAPDNRPAMREVLKMIRYVRAAPHVSSNSSDHSPGRWSDTVQSLPREEHLSV
ncbi:Inactive leucine-rich repeat receptor-like serine/threonine-protein kinase [Hibiscus syriacus]|uniref:Inactive leucine-rich repeat receptor-like serine/threonine-protein kinase n=1 Tax=Hibiscus syriacus TaxID=106335 RepID=A0A6A3BGD4_HIBSY|nr:Inactive leucine-rich repeat receptor-like serine/threonine-protein kinase [Hibiscus syriacus]